MSAIEQKIIALFSPLPFSLKARIVAALSQLLAKEAMQGETDSIEDEDLVITAELKKRISAIEERHERGKGKTYTKEEFRKHLDNLMSK